MNKNFSIWYMTKYSPLKFFAKKTEDKELVEKIMDDLRMRSGVTKVWCE